MSKIGDKLVEVEELLRQGLDYEAVSKIADVPVSWVYDVDLELSGQHEYGYEEQECQN